MIDRRKQAALTLKALKKAYPDAHCELDFKTPLQLIVATILSAQCTDKRVNLVTPALFKRFPTAKALAAADLAELEGLIRSTGFFRSKALSLKTMAAALVERHGGEVPDSMEELLKLRGVARKTANVVLGSAFGRAAGIAVDTHILRLSHRLALSDAKDPVKVEQDLMAVVPRKDWTFFSHALIWHGRRVCSARGPVCPECPMRSFCPKRGV